MKESALSNPFVVYQMYFIVLLLTKNNAFGMFKKNKAFEIHRYLCFKAAKLPIYLHTRSHLVFIPFWKVCGTLYYSFPQQGNPCHEPVSKHAFYFIKYTQDTP